MTLSGRISRTPTLAVLAALALAVAGCAAPSDPGPSTDLADVVNVADPTSSPSPTTGPSTPARSTGAPAPQPLLKPAPVVTKRTVTETKKIAFSTRTVKDPDLDKGTTRVRTKGVAGVRTLEYEVTLTDGKQTAKRLVSDTVTRKPVTKVVAVGTKVESSARCDPNYSGCVPIASDVDCAGGSGNGPAYVEGPVRVLGDDIYGLDADADGLGCE